MPDFINLLSEIAGKVSENQAATKHGKFRTSIMTAYTAYLPFYENVVLRRLFASGCRYNFLLVDAHDLARSLQDPTRMPRLAGRNYVLAPMLAKGAFHPKIIMLLGDHNARILVGSHNATLSGFGYNRELTTRIDLDRGFKGGYRAFFQEAWRSLVNWTNLQRDYLPPQVISAILRIGFEKHPWLRQNDEQVADTLFFSSLPEGESLWDKARLYLPEVVESIIVVGPYFDKEGAFIKRLYEDLKPQSIAIGLDAEAEHISLCRTEGLPFGVSFHDASKLIGRSDKRRLKEPGYLHAKALFFNGSGDQSVLITGSANPSSPAWLASSEGRNMEAVVLHRGKEAREVAEDLGLLQIPSLPIIGAHELDRLYAKSAAQHSSPSLSFKRSLVAEAQKGGIFVPGFSISQEEVDNCRVFFEDQSVIDNAHISEHEDGLLIEIDSKIQPITHVVLTLIDKSALNLIVHNPIALSKLATTSHQQKFQDALGSLSSDSPDFATLLRITSQLIFDEHKPKSAEIKVKTSTKADQSEEKEESSLAPLSVSIEETKHHQRRRRELHHSDLAFVIDALIYNLGIGLRDAEERNSPSEEEQVGKEEEETHANVAEIEKDNLLQICHKKIGTLVSRMCKRFEAAQPNTPDGLKAVEQLFAILAVLREVRANDRKLSHVIEDETLVPIKSRRKLLEASIKALFGDQKDLFGWAADHFKDDPENDMDLLLGLIIWLAWDCDFDVEELQYIPIYEREARHNALFELAKLFVIAIRAGNLTEAFEEAEHSAWKVCQAEKYGETTNWMCRYEQWAKELAKLKVLAGDSQSTGKPESGQLGVAIKERPPRFRVVLGITDSNVRLVEFGRDNDEVSFQTSAIRLVPMPPFFPFQKSNQMA
jgi:hypothetical protein